MPVLAVTANVLVSFALYFGIVALLYGGTDVAASMSSGEQQTKGFDDPDPPGGGSSGRKSVWAN